MCWVNYSDQILTKYFIINLICFKEVKISLLGIHSEASGLELHIHKNMSNKAVEQSEYLLRNRRNCDERLV